MLLRYSLNLEDDAVLLENAVQAALFLGLRTPDLMQPGKIRLSTREMGDALLMKWEGLFPIGEGEGKSAL